MPFPDEIGDVSVLDHDPRWPRDFTVIAARLGHTLGPTALAVDHIGSTSVPGLAAKDCIDVQAAAAMCTSGTSAARLPGGTSSSGTTSAPTTWRVTHGAPSHDV